MRERDFLNWVVAVAKQTGWKVWHVPAPMVADRAGGFVGARGARGLPDLVLIHDDPPTLVFAECKGETGRLSEAQRDFLQAARLVSETTWPARSRRLGVYVWKPGLEDFIERILKTRVLA